MTTEFTIWHAFAISGAIITILLAGIGVLSGIIFNGLRGSIEKLTITQNEYISLLASLKEHLPINYIRREQFSALERQVTEMRSEFKAEADEIRAQFHHQFERLYDELKTKT